MNPIRIVSTDGTAQMCRNAGESVITVAFATTLLVMLTLATVPTEENSNHDR